MVGVRVIVECRKWDLQKLREHENLTLFALTYTYNVVWIIAELSILLLWNTPKYTIFEIFDENKHWTINWNIQSIRPRTAASPSKGIEPCATAQNEMFLSFFFKVDQFLSNHFYLKFNFFKDPNQISAI